MKNLKLGISALALTLASTAFAQTTSNPWVIGVGAHGVNHMGVANGGVDKVFDNFDQVFTLNNYTITPPLSKLTIARNLNKYFVLDWQTSVGNIDNKRFDMGKEFFLQTGLGLQFKFAGLWNEESWFDPYARVGANYLRHDYSGLTFPRYDNANAAVQGSYNGDDLVGKANHFTAAGGIGSNFWLTKNFGLNLQGDYVATPGDNTNVPDFWQASASLMFRFGNTDRDKDGIKDSEDACPDVPGLAQFQGCPDTDGDGIADKDDKCPTVKGTAANNGCPEVTAEVIKELNNFSKAILFNSVKATIRPESNLKLEEIVKVMNNFSTANFVLEGYTDSTGSVVKNLQLSKDRAAAVKEYLVANGINADRLSSEGYGIEKPIASNKTEAGRAQNRRVEILLAK